MEVIACSLSDFCAYALFPISLSFLEAAVGPALCRSPSELGSFLGIPVWLFIVPVKLPVENPASWQMYTFAIFWAQKKQDNW